MFCEAVNRGRKIPCCETDVKRFPEALTLQLCVRCECAVTSEANLADQNDIWHHLVWLRASKLSNVLGEDFYSTTTELQQYQRKRRQMLKVVVSVWVQDKTAQLRQVYHFLCVITHTHTQTHQETGKLGDALFGTNPGSVIQTCHRWTTGTCLVNKRSSTLQMHRSHSTSALHSHVGCVGGARKKT